MDKKINARRECASSNFGGAIGGTIGSIFGSAINPVLSVPASIAGTTLGSVIGLLAHQNNNNLSYRRLKELLSSKLHSDFNSGFILDRSTLYNELEDFENRMRRNRRVYLDTYSYFINKEVWDFHDNSTQDEDAKLLLELGNISINVSSVNTGVVATLMSLNESYNFNINIDHHCVNGIQQIQAINQGSNQEYDFLICPADNFILSPSNGISVYKSLGPVNSHTQCTFRKKSFTDYGTKCIWAFDNSSAEMQYLLNIKMPRNVGVEYFSDKANIFEILSDMAGGDYITAWETLASMLRRQDEFEEITEFRYEVVFHVFAHNCWHEPDLNRERIAFKRLFQNEWRRCSLDRKRSLRLLQEDRNYLDNFAKGSIFMKKSK